MRLGEGDLGERDRVIDRERVGDCADTERRGEPDCADRGRLGDLVCDLSRDGLRVRDRERVADGERDGMTGFCTIGDRDKILSQIVYRYATRRSVRHFPVQCTFTRNFLGSEL